MGIMAFTPMGNTVTFNAAATPPTPVRALSTTMGGTQYRVHNTGNVVVYLGFGDNASAATNTATISLSGSTLSLMPGSVEVFTFNVNQYFTGATASGSSVVNITPGDGQ